VVTVNTTCFAIKQDTKDKNNVTLLHIWIFASWTLLWCTVKLQIPTRHQGQSNDRYQNRQLIEYMLKNFTLHNTNKIHFYSTYYSLCICIWTLKVLVNIQKKKSYLNYTLHPVIRNTCSSSFTCWTPWLANMTVNRHWPIIMWQIKFYHVILIFVLHVYKW
jgi:hypothetical protein